MRTVPGNVRLGSRVAIPSVADGATGTVGRISRGELDALIRNAEAIEYRSRRYNERPSDDSARFAGVKPLNARLVATNPPPCYLPHAYGYIF